MACLDDQTVAALLGGKLARAERDVVDDHVDGCAACRQLVANAARDHVARETVVDGDRRVSTGAETLPAGDGERIALAPGTVVGRYVVRDLLGAGGMGVVYEAHDPQLDRVIALKVVRAGNDPSRAARFVREAQAMARVSHRNVVPIYDAGQAEGLVFIAMKKIDGLPLREHLKQAGITKAQRVRLLVDAGRGLAAAHAAGIVHRDFKPDNVLVDADGTAQVADFGLAALAADEPISGDAFRTATGAVLGTPAYMAPEVKRGERADARSDQYSFAVTVDETLGTARSRRVAKATERASADDPAARFPSIEPVIQALEHRPLVPWLAGGTVALGAVAYLAWPAARPDGALACETAATERLASAFGPEARRAIADRLAHAPRVHPKDADAALARLDRFEANWLASRKQTCRAAASGELSAELADLRMACLDEKLDALGVVRERMQQVPPERGEAALAIAGVLGGVDACANPAGLRARAAIGPIAIAHTRALRTQIFDAHTYLQQGDYARAMQMFDHVLAEARQAALPSVEAEAILSRSVVLAETHQPGATEGFHEARAIAERIGDRELRIDALLALLADASKDRARASEVDLLRKLIESGLAELGGDQASRRGRLAGNLTNYYAAKRDWAEAMKQAQEATRLFTQVIGPMHPYTLMTRSTQAQLYSSQNDQPRALAITRELLADLRAQYGNEHPLVAQAKVSEGIYLAHDQHNTEADAAFREALAITERVYGPDHPRVAEVLRKIGYQSLDRDPAGSRAAFERAIRIFERTKAQPTDLAALTCGLGEAQLAAGDAASAVATLERAFALWGDSQVDPHLRPFAKYALARALWDTHGDRTRARSLAEQAHAEFIANAGPWKPKAKEVETWLTSHR
ncbi:MAG TPA: serine/threonine-protein kinase [Kofleriaceae bacterium]|nr:serine/threonine-protein kinase [Kofleriaceae bacterium]